MPNLPRYRLEYDEAKKKWALENEEGRTVRILTEGGCDCKRRP